MIKLQIIGNLGKDCIQNEVNGKHVINFNVAHSEKYKDSAGNLVERTIWVNCAYWTERTGIAQYLTKGKTVYAEGTPDVDAYMKENQPAATLRMRVHNIQLLGGSGNSDSASHGSFNSTGNQHTQVSAPVKPEVVKAEVVEVSDDSSDDLPF